MQQPKMIVLSLLGFGLRYGFEMEDFARRTNMRRWAKIGMSTIYKALIDLERDGAIKVRVEEGDKGPDRKAYSLTSAGRSQMYDLINHALSSELPVLSERIAGLVFAPLLGSSQAEEAIRASMLRSEENERRLAASALEPQADAIGLAVVEFYRDVWAAEREAMRKVLEALASKTGRKKTHSRAQSGLKAAR